jgi:hypothetical protein
MLRNVRVARVGLALALASGLAACSGDPAAPARSAFDAPQLNAGAAALSGGLAHSGWQSFRAVAPAVAASAANHAPVAAQGLVHAAQAPDRADLRAAVLRARATLESLLASRGRPGVQLVAVVPNELLGTTFVWDPTLQQYVADSGRTDAPANGVRHVLYPVNPFTAQPASVDEVGYVDLIDEGADLPNAAAVRIVVTVDGANLLDYRLRIDAAPSQARLRVQGVLSAGSDQVEFEVEGEVRDGLGAAFTYRLAVPAHQFRADARIAATGTAVTVQERIVVGSDAVGFTATHEADRVAGAVEVNGVPFATIEGPAGLPDFRRADGQPLSPAEAQALSAILHLTGRTIMFFADLLAPVGDLVHVG